MSRAHWLDGFRAACLREPVRDDWPDDKVAGFEHAASLIRAGGDPKWWHADDSYDLVVMDEDPEALYRRNEIDYYNEGGRGDE